MCIGWHEHARDAACRPFGDRTIWHRKRICGNTVTRPDDPNRADLIVKIEQVAEFHSQNRLRRIDMAPQANDCKRHEDRRINEVRAAHVFQVADILR